MANAERFIRNTLIYVNDGYLYTSNKVTCLSLFVWMCVCTVCQLLDSFTYFGQPLRCAHKRIVSIMKVYIERNNVQFELIRFRKQNHLHSRLLLRSEEFNATDVFTLGMSLQHKPARYIVTTLNYNFIVFFVFVFKCSRPLQHASRVCRRDCVQIVEICIYFYERRKLRSGYFREQRVYVETGLISVTCRHCSMYTQFEWKVIPTCACSMSTTSTLLVTVYRSTRDRE